MCFCGLEFALTLADGTRLALCAGDEEAARVLTFLARTAELSPASVPLPAGTRRLLAATKDEPSLPCTDGSGVCLLEPPDVQHLRRQPASGRGALGRPKPLTSEQWFWRQLMRLSAGVAYEILPRGGVLLHSGLAACPDMPGFQNLTGLGSILLAGRSGVGKTTASRRLPPPWRALADDLTLVVRDESGAYWAHPWPTWSSFFGEEKGDGRDTWDVQQAAPLRAIFVLEQGGEDRVEPLDPGHAVALLAELARQTSTHFLRGWPLDKIAAFNLQCFENLCALVRTVPAYLLHVSLDGAFWEEIRRAVLGKGSHPS